MSHESGDDNDKSIVKSRDFFNDSDIVCIKQKPRERAEIEITITEIENRTQVHRSQTICLTT